MATHYLSDRTTRTEIVRMFVVRWCGVYVSRLCSKPRRFKKNDRQIFDSIQAQQQLNIMHTLFYTEFTICFRSNYFFSSFLFLIGQQQLLPCPVSNSTPNYENWEIEKYILSMIWWLVVTLGSCVVYVFFLYYITFVLLCFFLLKKKKKNFFFPKIEQSAPNITRFWTESANDLAAPRNFGPKLQFRNYHTDSAFEFLFNFENIYMGTFWRIVSNTRTIRKHIKSILRMRYFFFFYFIRTHFGSCIVFVWRHKSNGLPDAWTEKNRMRGIGLIGLQWMNWSTFSY